MNIPCYQLLGIAQKMGLSLDHVLQHCQTLGSRLYFKVPPELAVFVIDGRQLESPRIVQFANRSPIEYRPDVHFLALPPKVCANMDAQTESHVSSSDYGISDTHSVCARWSDHVPTLSRHISIRAEPTFALLPCEQSTLDVGLNFRKALPRTATARVEAKDLYVTNETFAGIKARVETSREEGRFNMERRKGVFSEQLYQTYLAFERFWTKVRGEDLPPKDLWRKAVCEHLKGHMATASAKIATSLICPSDEDFKKARDTHKEMNVGFPPSAFMILHDTALEIWDLSPDVHKKNGDLQHLLEEAKHMKSDWARYAAAIINVAPRRGRPKKTN